MRKIIHCLISLIILFLPNYLYSQEEVISTSGNSQESGGVSLDWTVGECMVATYSISTGALTQGLHQSTYTITAIKTNPDLDLQLKIYPIPADRYLTIETNTGELESLKAVLYDLNGKKILQHDFKTQGNRIDLSTFPSGEYLLKLTDQKKNSTASYKIVKH